MANWRRLFSQRILNRGEVYYENEMVLNKNLEADHEHFTAVVQGGVGKYYDVSGRLRPDGRASKLACNCSWAQKGHRCKHEVASLLAIEQYQQQLDPAIESNDPKISFKDWLPTDIKQKILQAAPAVDPFNIIGQRVFTEKEYEHALQLDQQLTLTQFHSFDNKMQNYQYIWEFVDNDGQDLTLIIKFARWQLISIAVQSLSRIKDQQAVTILGLLKFIQEYIIDNPFDLTNQAAHNLLSLYNDEPASNDEPITLRAFINTYTDLPAISFKLGKGTHLYKVRDLYELLDNVESRQPVRLGKFFNEPINPQKMDHSSHKWLNFITRVVDARNLGSYYTSSPIEKIELEHSIADDVNDLLYHGTKLYIDKHPVGYTKDKLNLDLKITMDHDAADVQVGNLYARKRLIRGNRHYYGFYKGVWIEYDGITPDYLYQLGLYPGDDLHFSKKTINKFAYKVLPRLGKAEHLKVTGAKELKAALPPEANFIFKLDYRNGKVLLKATVQYGHKEYELNRYYTETEQREADQEEKVQAQVKRYFNNFKDGQYILSNDEIDTLDAFLDNGITNLKQLGNVQITANFRTLLKGIKTKMEVGVSVNLTDDLLDVDLNGPKYKWEDIQAALKAYQEKRHYFVLQSGLLQKTAQPTIEQLAQTLHDLGIKFKDFIHGKLNLPAYRAFYLAKKMKSANALHFSSNADFKALIDDLSKNQLKQNMVPASLARILRPYQKAGFNWLSTIVNYNFGGLLADEMGLGKTLQILALILARKEQKKEHSFSLIVAPASVVYNWQNEANKFTPNLRVAVLGGNKQARTSLLRDAQNYDLLITSYQSLNHDLEAYQGLTFDLEIIDEAQNIKNYQSVTAQSVKVIQAHHKLALTGTPIENKLSELWSIFDYLMPGFLGSYLDFRKKYEIPIVKENKQDIQKQLSDQVAPFILRRLKKDVLADLPEKDEEIVKVKMSGKQAELYNLQTQKIIAQLNGQGNADFKKSRFQVLAQITKIREICCDPHLLYENYHGQSAKLIATINLIQDNLENGHKILLFSQFTSMLDILHEKLSKLHITLYTITGATPKEKRQEQIHSFNSSDKTAVFLISLKAGGTGINLTSADVVIHYDPWWNLAAENQATDRAHRIGQKHSVKIYKMVAQDTIEEKIIALQQKKAELANAILSNDSIASAVMNRDDLLKILQ